MECQKIANLLDTLLENTIPTMGRLMGSLP